MQKINNYLLLIFLLMSIHVCAQEDTGYLSVDVDENFVISLDTLIVSNHSFSNLALKPGTYKIRAFNPDDISWYQNTFDKVIKIIPGEKVEINFKQNNYYRIYSTPINSKVFFQDKLLGKTPLFLNKDIYNDIELTLQKNGFKNKTFLLSANSNEYFINFNERDESQNRKVFLTGIEKSNLKWIEEGLILTSLLSSWTSFFFKREADKSYEKYLNSANPQKMEDYFNKAENFDTYAEIAIGVSIVSLGTYLYILLTD